MELKDFFIMMRELQDIKQKDIANRLTISPQAINRYEAGKSTLSKESLVAYSKFINMDPEFFCTGEGNPFLSRDLIKIIFPETAGFINFMPLEFLLEVNERLILLLLLDEKNVVEKLMAKTWVEKPIGSIAVFDYKNLYVLKQEKSAGIVGILDTLAKLTQRAIKERKRISYVVLAIDKTLGKKIKDWDSLNRKDIESLFDVAGPVIGEAIDFHGIRRTSKDEL